MTCALAIAASMLMEGVLLGAPIIQGDGELLRMVRDAASTQASAWQAGRLRATVVREARGRRIAGETRLLWKSDKRFLDYQAQEEGRARRGLVIIAPPNRFEYHAERERAFRRSGDRRLYPLPEALDVRPQNRWFHFEGQTRWDEVLDPNSPRSARVTRFVVRKQGEQIVIDRHTTGSALRIVASLRFGGNIVSYTSIPGDNPDAFDGAYNWHRKGEFEWRQYSQGRWYPSRIYYERSMAGDPEELDLKYEAKITECAGVSPPDSQFIFNALQIPRGTAVVDYANGAEQKRWRVGGTRPPTKSGGITSEQFERLADELRSGGFAKPDRAND